MAKKPTPLAGEVTTTNYGWVKPTVGSSVDLWGGYINADLDSIDGVVHAIDTRPVGVTVSDTPPANPLVGQEWFDSVSGQLYVWYDDGNSSQWVIAVNAAVSLLPASTTVLGGVKVDGTTIKAAADGTISTTVVPMGDNRIINGDMRIDQRNNGASGTAQGYTVDRWFFGNALATAGKGTWQQVSGSTSIGFPLSLQFTSASAYTPLAGDGFSFNQRIEYDMMADFAFSTASAQPITLSFWVWTSGLSYPATLSGAIRNYANTRSYPFTYSVSAGGGAWTYISVTIPGDTGGTWVTSGNAGGMLVFFDLGSGATFRAPAGAWIGGNFAGANGAANVVAANGAVFKITGVKLEVGSVATPFNRQSLAKSMADCQSYYCTRQTHVVAGTTGVGLGINWPYSFPVLMRASPTVVFNMAGGTGYTPASPAITNDGLGATATGAGTAYSANVNWTASAEL